MDSLHEPFMASVRLRINTSHPQASALLQDQATLLLSVLRFGILEQLLLTVADGHADQTGDTFDEGAVGYVLDELCQLYLERTLRDTVNMIKWDRGDFLSRLQASTRFLQGEGHS